LLWARLPILQESCTNEGILGLGVNDRAAKLRDKTGRATRAREAPKRNGDISTSRQGHCAGSAVDERGGLRAHVEKSERSAWRTGGGVSVKTAQ
jgi:hypothetical protein